jgi:autotransporter-associated beta strand protein
VTKTWDGGTGGTGTELGTAANWSPDGLPSANGDTAEWNGTVAGNLTLAYTTGLAGAAGNAGLNLSLTAAQTGNVAIDSGASATAVRLNGITIASGAGAFTLGNSANTFNFTLGGAAGTRTWTNNSSNTATINSDVLFGAGGAGAQVLAIGGSGNWAIAAPLYLTNNTGLNSVTLNKSGAGTLTLTASNVNSCYGPVTVSGGTIIAGVAANNPQYGVFEKTTLLTINAGAKVQAMGANAFAGWSGGTLPVTINGGELAVGNGVNATGNHQLAALILNGGTISGLGDPMWGGFNLSGDVSVTDNSTISATNTNTANIARTITVSAGKTLTWSGTIHNGNNNAWTTTLTFAGAGTTMLTGTNIHSGTTTINGGILQVGDGGTTGSVGTGSVVNNAALVFNRSNDLTVNQVIGGTGTLQKLGAGTLTLSGVSTYSGATTVSTGKLSLGAATGSLDPSTALTLSNGTTFSTASAAASRLQTVSSLNMDGATLEFGILGASSDQLGITGAATLSGSNTVRISGSAAPGVFTLVSSGAPLAGTITLDSSAMPAGFLSYGGAINGNNYELTVSGNAIPGTAYWKGDVSGVWNDASLAPNSNWALDAAGTTDAGQVPGASSDVIFASSGASNNSTTLGVDTAIDSLTFGAGSFAVGGGNALGIIGTNANGYALEVLGGSSATLSTATSSWSGVTRVNSTGTLTTSSSGACGNPDAALELEGNLKLNADLTKGDLTGTGIASADTAATLNIQSVSGSTFNGTLEDGLAVLSFTKSGTGWLTLVENMTNTGPTTVAAGRLEIGNGATTGALGAGDITVNAGGVLSWNRLNDITIANNIFGAGANLIKDGTGTLTLTGNSNFATAGGSGFIINSGKVVLGSPGAVPNNIVFGVRGGKLDLNEKDIICGWLDGFDPGLVTDDTATAGTTTLTLNIGGAPVYSGSINNGAGGRVLSLVKTGNGTQILSGTSNYTGGTTLLTGLLQANSNSALGTGPVNLPGNNVDITRFQLGNGANLSNSIEIGVPTRTNFLGAVYVPTATDSATLSGSILVKASGLVGGTVNGGTFYGPTDAAALLTLAGAVNADAATTQVLIRGGNVRLNTAGTATNWRNDGYLSLGANNALATASVVAIAGSNAATLDLNGFNQTLAGVGSSTAHNFTATITSGTPAVLTLATDPAIDYATYTSVLPIGSLGTNVLDGNTVIAGNLSLVKQGAGTAQLQGPSTFGGNLTISAGSLVADRSNNVNNPANSALGNPQTDRSITVDNGATLKFQLGDIFGSATTSVVSTLVVNAGGTVINNGNNFNTFGPVVLNGGTITTTGGAIGGYQSYNLLGTVNVGGSSASTLSVTGPGNAFNGFHLNTATIFDVADATGDNAADLVVSAPLVDRNASLGGSGGLTKSGSGTMSITTVASYTGATEVQAGVLSITNSYLADGADVVLGGSGTINLDYAGTDTIRSLYIGGILQYAGVWGATGSGAQYETSAITGSGTLTVTTGATPPGYAAWASDSGLTVGVNDAPGDDPDFDGIENLLEYVFGGVPLASSQSQSPTSTLNPTDLIIAFKRTDLSETDTTVIVQWSSDLGATWTDFATVGAASAGPVSVTENAASADDITVAIPRSNAVNGRLFGRVKAVK